MCLVLKLSEDYYAEFEEANGEFFLTRYKEIFDDGEVSYSAYNGKWDTEAHRAYQALDRWLIEREEMEF